MKKICFLIGYYPINRGGAEYQAYLLYKELINKYQVVYISIGQDVDKILYDDNVKIYCLKAPKFILFSNLYFLLYKKIISILEQEKPNYIYQRVGYSATGIAAYYSKTNGCKMIWHISSNNDLVFTERTINKNSLFQIIERSILRYGIRNANYIIGQTNDQNNLLKTHYRRECDLLVPNFHPKPKSRIEKHYPIKILWIANIKPLKNPEIFIDLASKFQSSSNVRFIMIGRPGNTRYQKKLDQRIKGLNKFEYKGELSQDKVNDLLCHSHIFVNTSRYEGFPNTFIQAWMRKVPVVSLYLDQDDVIKKEKIGFHSRSFNQMVLDVEALIKDDKLRKSMGEKARQYALKNHSLSNIQKIVDLFDK